MVVKAVLKLDIEAMRKDKQNLVPVQLGNNEPVYGSVKGIIRQMGVDVFECYINVIPGMEDYVIEKMDQEKRLLFPE